MFHRHKWYIVGSQTLNWRYEGVLKDMTTQVLHKCSECGKVKTTEVDGHWTTEQLKGR
jgi:hypothetical protein